MWPFDRSNCVNKRTVPPSSFNGRQCNVPRLCLGSNGVATINSCINILGIKLLKISRSLPVGWVKCGDQISHPQVCDNQWDFKTLRLLASTGQTPAGPLFSIDCPRGSVCQLHLPHCEMVPGEGLGSLSVAHVTGDNVELLPPLRVTDTHVVVNITDLSLWGLVRRYIPFFTIWAQVLPFLQSPTPEGSVLKLVVVPADVSLTKVESFHKESSYMFALPVNCSLTRWGTYSLCCAEAVKIIPQPTEIYWSKGPNFHPTFQVFLSAKTKKVTLRLLEKNGGAQVWEADIQLPAPGASSMGGRQAEHVLVSSTPPGASSMGGRQTEPVLVSSTPPGASSMGGRQTEHAQSGSAEKRLLLDTLDQLVYLELKSFKWHLTQGVLDGFSPIPRGHMENADRHDTVDKMVETYTLEGALKISVEILRIMKQNDLSQKLGSSSLGGRQTEHAQSDSAQEQLRSARREFVQRASKAVMDSLLDGLLEKRVINDNETESVKVEKERAERARVLIDMVLRKGDQPCSLMMDLLADLDSFLHSVLGFN